MTLRGSIPKIVAACVTGVALWWFHREWWERFAPIVPFAEPFDEPGGGFGWPAADWTWSGQIDFTFSDGTVGPGTWNPRTQQIEKAEP